MYGEYDAVLNDGGGLAGFRAGKADAFVARFDAGGLDRSTYLGGSKHLAYGLTANCYGVVHVVGNTKSPDFPTKNAANDAFGTPAPYLCASFLTRLDFGHASPPHLSSAKEFVGREIPKLYFACCDDGPPQLVQSLRDRLLEAQRALEGDDRPASARAIGSFIREVTERAVELPSVFREVAAELEAADLDLFP